MYAQVCKSSDIQAGPLKPLKKVPRVSVDVEVETPEVLEESVPEGVSESIPEDSEKKGSKKRKRRAEHEEEEKAETIESRYMNKIYSKITKPEPIAEAHQETSMSVEEQNDEILEHETLTTSTSPDAAAEKTIFISNLPIKVLTSKPLLRSLKQLFSSHGERKIQSIRFRSIAFTDLVPRKVGYITKNFHPERDTLNAYIVFDDEGSVQNAVEELNGMLWEGKHLRVDSVSNPSVFPPSFLVMLTDVGVGS